MEEISFHDLVEAIEAVVRCAICLENVKPPVILCANGHGTCSSCRGSLSKCPSCSGNFLDIQVRLLDHILELVPQPCKYSGEGCEIFVNKTLNGKHELYCRFRPIQCVIGHDASCTWRGSLIKWESHVEDEHASLHWGKFNLNKPSHWYYHTDWGKLARLVLVENELFLDISYIIDGKLLQMRRFIPKETPSHDYYFSTLIKNKQGDIILQYKMKASLMDESESIENSDNCISIPNEEFIEAVRDRDGDLLVELKVYREKIKNQSVKEEISLHDLDEAIEEVARCAICLEKLQPSVILCANGHCTCSLCRGSLSKCLRCSENFLSTQVRILDQILELLPQPCKYSGKGCEVFINQAFNKTHEKFCQFRPIQCMIGRDKPCTWRGSLITWKSHVEDEHGSFFFVNLNLNEWYYSWMYLANITRLFIVENELFLDFRWRVNEQLLQVNRFVPKQTPSYNYYFSILIINDQEDVIMQYKMKATPTDETESIDNSDNYIGFPIKALENAKRDDDGVLKVKLKVTREKIRN